MNISMFVEEMCRCDDKKCTNAEVRNERAHIEQFKFHLKQFLEFERINVRFADTEGPAEPNRDETERNIRADQALGKR